jgi:outer membrane biosynthesis protein TonB
MAEQQQDTDQNGHEEERASYEKELAGYLQERIKPGLNRGAIPLLARSIAKEIARRERSRASGDTEGSDQPSAETDEEQPSAESDEEQPSAETDEEQPGAETDEEQPSAESDEEQPSAETDEEQPSAESDEEQLSAESDEEQPSDGEAAPDFEADMRELQAELGEDWILSFSVHGDDAWLSAEKADGSQHVEADTAAELVEAVNEGGGRSS